MVKKKNRRIPLFREDQNATAARKNSLLSSKFLNFVETRTLKFADQNRLNSSLISGLFFEGLTQALNEESEELNRLSPSSALNVLKSPLCVCEFRRDGDNHIVQVEAPWFQKDQAKDEFESLTLWSVRDLHQQFRDPTTNDVSDDQLISSLIDRFSLRSSAGGESKESFLFPPDVQALLEPVSSVISRHISELRSTGHFSLKTDRFFRSDVLGWLDGVVSSSNDQLSGARDKEVDGEYEEIGLVELPIVYVGNLVTRPDIIFVCCVSSVDIWFVDETIPDDIGRMPEIFFGLYQAPYFSNVMETSQLHDLEAMLQSSLSSVHGKNLARRRGGALKSAAGEAGDIARKWFGEGVSILLGEQTSDAHLHNESTLDFWSRFVEKLLCLKAEGVLETETFPFDRAFIIADSGASPESVNLDNPKLLIRVLEAALESTAPADRFVQRTSVERLGRDIELEFDVTSKTIVSRTEMMACRDRLGNLAASRITGLSEQSFGRGLSRLTAQLEEQGSIAAKSMGPWTQAADMALEAMLIVRDGDKPAETKAERDQIENENAVRRFFSKEGIMFEYEQRVDLRKDFPLLHAINKHYLDQYAMKLPPVLRDNYREWSQQSAGQSKSKVVLISYEPRLAQKNRRPVKDSSTGVGAQEPYYLDPSENRFTLILIADEDPEKSVPDLKSEREDLRLLVEMVIRQRLRDKYREVDFLEKRVDVVESLVNGLLHKFKSFVVDDDKRDELEAQWEGYRSAVRFDTTSLQLIGPFSSEIGYLDAIWFSDSAIAEPTSNTLQNNSLEKLKRDFQARVSDWATDMQASLGIENIVIPKFEIELNSVPDLRLNLPLVAVRECIDVCLKNAVEAAVMPNAPKPADVKLILQHSFDIVREDWSLDIIIENTTAPISEDVWDKMTADQPKQVGQNSAKPKSTGVGLFACRQLLKNGLGNRADIHFHRPEIDRVQARIQLPGEEGVLTSQNSNESTDELSDVEIQVQSIDVLILEDEEEHRAKTLSEIQSRAPHLNIVVVETLEQFEATIRHSMPELLISDLNVPRSDPNIQGEAVYGLTALESFAERARQDGTYPPIWIASGASSNEARRILTDGGGDEETVLGAGYSVVEQDQASEIITANQAVIIDYKNLGMNDGAKELAKKIADYFAASPTHKPIDNQTMDAQDKARAKYRSIKLGEYEKKYGASSSADAQKLIYADATEHSPISAMRDWFSMPPLKDPASISNRSKSIWSPTWHKSTVLLLPETPEWNSANIRYWLLNNNAVIASQGRGRLASLISKIKRESTGPIATARHDVFNLVSSPPEEFQSLTVRLQNLLAISPDIYAGLDRSMFLESDDEASKREIERSLDAARASFDANATREAFEQVHLKLIAMMDAAPENVPRMQLVVGSLVAAMKVIGVIENDY